MILMGGCDMEIDRKNIISYGIYCAIVILTVIVNIISYICITWIYINKITNYIIGKITCLDSLQIPSVFVNLKRIAIDLMINICQLCLAELVLFILFSQTLNRFFKIDKLFTNKKIVYFLIVSVFIQIIISCWLWYY
jgi:hypothetical protein